MVQQWFRKKKLKRQHDFECRGLIGKSGFFFIEKDSFVSGKLAQTGGSAYFFKAINDMPSTIYKNI
jgi:hypothetical protein